MSYYNLGNALQAQGKLEEAVACHQRALSLNPDDPVVHNNLGNALKEQGKLEEAVACYQRALSLNPNNYTAHYNLGSALQEQGKLEEAVACHQRALSLNPDDPMVHNNLGNALQAQGKLEEVIACYRRALSLSPDDPLVHYNLAIIYLLKGNLKEGWEEYKYRFRKKNVAEYFDTNYLNIPQPFWDGSEIKNKTILLYSEQGFGDTIQFIRYVPMVLEKCDKIIVVCPELLVALMHQINGIHQVVKQGEQLPDFDFHCPLLSLPSVFNTTLETVPATVPYITNDPQKVLKWRERLQSDSARLKIGLCWAGNAIPRNRSISLNMFSMLGDMGNITFYSLQKGKAAEQANVTPKGMELVDYTKDLNDFSDTAAFIENLDLIISVDTSVAHLAGALGKPVWTLLQFIPDWRWLLDRADNPWYPTMRLFRQSSIGDWSNVIISIKVALSHLKRTICT
jgi:regulator of sirC expression with transglutaminase-like and TPR domain